MIDRKEGLLRELDQDGDSGAAAGEIVQPGIDLVDPAPGEDGEPEAPKQAEQDELERQLAEVETQIQMLATGVTEADYHGDGEGAFDLNSEVQSLLEPFVSVLKGATENAREIERLRREIGGLRKRESLARRAVATIDPIRLEADAEDDQALLTILEKAEGTWERRADSSADLALALEQQLEDRLASRVTRAPRRAQRSRASSGSGA